MRGAVRAAARRVAGCRPRWQELATPLAVALMLITLAAEPAAADPTTPTGVGDLMPTPDMVHGDSRTLFEQFSPTVYQIDTDLGFGPTDGVMGVFNGFAAELMFYVAAAVRAAIVVSWWLFSLTDIPQLNDAVSTMIGGASGELMGWLFPSALAAGGAIAFAMNRQARGSGLGQVAWVLAAGLLAVSFATAPANWVRGVDNTRQLGAAAVLQASSGAIAGNSTDPIDWPQPGYNGTTRDTLLRKSADATWRAFAVTPWCIANFGSVEACKRYGVDMLKQGPDLDKRKKWMQKNVYEAEGGKDAATPRYVQGHDPFSRIGVLAIAAIAATIFAAMTIGLAFAALMALVMVFLLLICGVIFALLWVIPGKPRQWGLSWFETLLGLIMQSVLATLVFGSVLALVTATMTLTTSMGWLPVIGLVTAICFGGIKLRRVLETITSMGSPGGGSAALLGYGAMRGVSRLLGAGRSWAGSVGSNGGLMRSRRPSLPDSGDESRQASPRPSGGSAPGARRFRTYAPAGSTISRAGGSRRTTNMGDYRDKAGLDSPEAGAAAPAAGTPARGGSAPAGRTRRTGKPSQPTSTRRPAGNRRTTNDSNPDDAAASTPAPRLSNEDGSRPGSTGSSPSRNGRDTRPPTPRRDTSVGRDGPPLPGSTVRRSPATPPVRRYREYPPPGSTSKPPSRRPQAEDGEP